MDTENGHKWSVIKVGTIVHAHDHAHGPDIIILSNNNSFQQRDNFIQRR